MSQLKLPEGHALANSPPFREGTAINRNRFLLLYNAGGIGDYIHWTRPIQWICENVSHAEGTILSPPYFAELAEHWLGKYSPRWKVESRPDVTENEIFKNWNGAIRAPDSRQLANACGFHLTQLGWIYYPGMDHVPKGWEGLPRIEGDEADLSAFGLPADYAVLTTNATSAVRRLSNSAAQGILSAMREKGQTPVLLGKKDLGCIDYGSKEIEGLDLTGCIDLRERTTLLEAACVMARARYVAGLDNGLLHLACCSDVPVIFAFTTVDPRHRVPQRRVGTKTVTIVPPEDLKCRFCQSQMRFLVGHNFSTCIYGDAACCELLGAEPFRSAVEKILA